MLEIKVASLSRFQKLTLAARIVTLGAIAERKLDREPLPDLVVSWGSPRPTRGNERLSPHGLGRVVARVLGERRRCVVQSLVLHRLLAAQGDRPELVVGIPGAAENHNAHAWVELDSVEVGPPPGSSGNLEMARFR
ncbi:MAG: lasso peptide biosynthesis B2 protein [Actinobacteria bacterium]|nr:lasso peptide biosynthesis B2 protein [Actinomycetota bacterium]